LFNIGRRKIYIDHFTQQGKKKGGKMSVATREKGNGCRRRSVVKKKEWSEKKDISFAAARRRKKG